LGPGAGNPHWRARLSNFGAFVGNGSSGWCRFLCRQEPSVAALATPQEARTLCRRSPDISRWNDVIGRSAGGTNGRVFMIDLAAS
jgi:hypothetical protein